MTTLAELEGLVVTITGRPDKAADIQQAIRMQTLKLHRSNFYKSDLRVASETLSPNSDNRYVVDLSVLTRNRYIDSVVNYVPNGYGSIDYKRLDANNIFANYNLEKTNYFYTLGLELVIKSYTAISEAQITYYSYPDVAIATYASWIADRYPDIVADAASAELFKKIGKDSEASKYKDLASFAIQDILKDEVG